MRLMVFFDLPVKTKNDKRAYARFHKFLVRSGFDMIQYSIYARICNGPEAVETQVMKLKAHKPPDGSVRYMQVTEKQFVNMQVLVGAKRIKEDTKYASQLSFF